MQHEFGGGSFGGRSRCKDRKVDPKGNFSELKQKDVGGETTTSVNPYHGTV